MAAVTWLLLVLVVLGLSAPSWAGRVSPTDQELELVPEKASQAKFDHPTVPEQNIDFMDGDDPSIKSHWALLVAGSAGWGNYRHQADVYHAYQVLRSGGYREDHIVVMAYDDIANNPENPMPGKVFNRPGGPDVYEGVRIDYKGQDVTAENFLAVLEGNKAAVVNKGTGRVIDSGPNDKVFLFYSDHGAAGVVGMPAGPFLYADELMKTLRKKYHHKGFKEMVMYIEACESGSMFEGLLDDNLAAYVTTAANAYESSWATYCPSFFGSNAVPSNSLTTPSAATSTSSGSTDTSAETTASSSSGSSSMRVWLQKFVSTLRYIQHLLMPRSFSTAATTSSSDSSANGYHHNPSSNPSPPPQFYTCLGDLYSVAWMEDAEVSDLTRETLLQQYKSVKARTSQNFTYDQGSHVMQYGALDIDTELAGDYEGMMHNGSDPPSPTPSHEWLEFEQQQEKKKKKKQQRMQQQMQQQYSAGAMLASSSFVARPEQQQHPLLLQQYSSVQSLTARLAAAASGTSQAHSTVLQRDADLLPLLAAAKHSHCPKRRAAAATALQAAAAARQALESAARAAVIALIKRPGVGYAMLTSLGLSPFQVLPQAPPAALQALFAAEPAASGAGKQQQAEENEQQQQQQRGLLPATELLGDVVPSFVESLMGPLPGRQGRPLVDDWDCLRSMVQAWEGPCGQLDQYGMKHTRLFANLCNAGVHPHDLAGVLSTGPCAA